MEPPEVRRAIEAAQSTVNELGLQVDDAGVIHNSNRLVVRLLPCDVLARVAPPGAQADSLFEVEVARRLAETDAPVGALDPRAEPRAYTRNGFVVTLWTYHEPVAADIAPADYADALFRLHAGFREIDLEAPHFTDRVAEAQREVDDPKRTPELLYADRELLSDTLSRLSAAIAGSGREQLLHGEPHPGNLLNSKHGPLFVDLGTCVRGPVEFDIAHAPDEVAELYPDANPELLQQCRILTTALATTWRWQQGDQLPNGRNWRHEGLKQIRAALERFGLE